MKKLVLVLLLVLFVASTASAFDIKLTNPTDKLVYYSLVWHDCDWEGFGSTANMGGGELSAGEDSTYGGDYNIGRWTIRWYDHDGYDKTFLIKIDQKPGLLILKAKQEPEFVSGI